MLILILIKEWLYCTVLTLSKTATYGTATKALDVSGYVWIRNFFFPDTASIHTYLVNLAYESALQSGNVWIRYQSEIVWMLNRSRYFFIRWCKKIKPWSWVLYREYCIQDGNLVPRFSQGRARCKFCVLYNVCFVANIPRGVLDTGVNLDTCWIGVEGKFDFGEVLRVLIPTSVAWVRILASMP